MRRDLLRVKLRLADCCVACQKAAVKWAELTTTTLLAELQGTRLPDASDPRLSYDNRDAPRFQGEECRSSACQADCRVIV